ncbi:MAG: D-alanyl-D-alanine carboxypeptidase/D-alanyl-D-alanine-endopeptidase [Kofleriaceae bacterium]
MAFRGALLAIVVVAGIVGDPPHGRTQGSGSSQQTPADPDTDDDGSGGGIVGALVAPTGPAERKPWVRERFAAAQLTRPTLAAARVSYAVWDLSSGDQLVARDPDAAMNLASNAKLFTSIAALGALGSGFRWRTSVYAEPPDATGVVQGDIYLRGRGDPLLSVASIEALATEIAARGVRRVTGRLVIDASYFDTVVDPPKFDEQPTERAAFRAPVASLGVSRGAITVIVTPDPNGTASVRVEPNAGKYLRVTKQQVVTVVEGRSRLRLEVKPQRDHLAIEITGQVRAGEGSWDLRRRVDDPARLAAEVFRRALAERGVTIAQRAFVSGPIPMTARAIAVHDSATLADVVRYMNKLSDNYVAESVLKTLGAERKTTTGPATWADGTIAVQAQLATLGLVPGSYRVDNGSGLYSATAVSANQLITLLRAAHADYRIGPDLVASLPVGGLDGTLVRRWQGRPAGGRVRAKTGTLEKVVTLAGYVGVDSGRPLAFAILVNDVPPGQRPAARAMTDEMIDVLAVYLGAR